MLGEALRPGSIAELGGHRRRADDVGHQHGGNCARRRGGEAEIGDVARDVEQYDRFVPDHPCVVAGRYIHDVARRELVHLSVGHFERHAAGDQYVKVVELTEIGSRLRLDVVGPAPARFENRSAHCHGSYIHNAANPVGETPRGIRLVEALPADRPSPGAVIGGCRTQSAPILWR